MRVTAIKCPKCEMPSKLNGGDLLFLCESCGTLHYVDDGKDVIVEYEVAKTENETDATQYLPVWKLESEFSAVADVSGFWSNFKKTGGKLDIYLPAWNLDPAEFRRWAVNLTTGAWTHEAGGEIGIRKRIPASMSLEQAHEMADFVVVTIEAEKPGTLQHLNYTLNILSAAIVYIPQNPQ